MTDKEKLALIDTMIADFWEYNTDETQAKGAIGCLSAIATVIEYKGEE